MACTLLALPGVLPALAEDNPAPASHPHVTAHPPLQVIPAESSNVNSVQQRMRQCNSQADARKLRDTVRETFIKSCMAAHPPPARKPDSSAASEPQHGS